MYPPYYRYIGTFTKLYIKITVYSDFFSSVFFAVAGFLK